MITKERKIKTEKIIKKRVKQFQISNPYYSGLEKIQTIQKHRKPLSETHRFYKESQLGCKKPSCNICRHKKPKRETQI
jgi:hypothetical protein